MCAVERHNETRNGKRVSIFTSESQMPTSVHRRPDNLPSPPQRPSGKGLARDEYNDIRKEWERAMYQYIIRYGTIATELCGPCSRTRTQCISPPPGAGSKCARCFRGHDVCEKWDDAVQAVGRRRVKSGVAPNNKKVNFYFHARELIEAQESRKT